MRVLYVEDEKVLADAVIHLLKKSNIDVDWADNGEEGCRLAENPAYDCLVLDVMLPEMSGIEILVHIRKKNITTPVIMLSALAEVEDKVRGLNSGADDYLGKPFKTSELIARIQALTRRPRELAPEIIRFEDLEYCVGTRNLNGTILTEKEAGIMELLIKNSGKVVNKEILLSHVWGASSGDDDNYVEVYASYLRKKLKNLKSAVTIKTIRGLGYKLEKI